MQTKSGQPPLPFFFLRDIKYILILRILAIFEDAYLKSPPYFTNTGKENMLNLKLATFGAGCFWCVEAIFEALEGVMSAVSGYAGGEGEHPTYEEVSSGTTGHAEAVQIAYDPSQISYAELLEVFWAAHDPTTPNRQGADVGTQYRSVIFYHDAEQRRLAEESKRRLAESGEYKNPIVTEIVPVKKFSPAEQYHQRYYQSNPEAPYCRLVITPKFDAFIRKFKDKLKRS